MSNVQINAAAIYASNIAETRDHFAYAEDALREEYLDSDMDCATFDRKLASLRASLAFHLAQEADLYRLNLAAPLDIAIKSAAKPVQLAFAI